MMGYERGFDFKKYQKKVEEQQDPERLTEKFLTLPPKILNILNKKNKKTNLGTRTAHPAELVP